MNLGTFLTKRRDLGEAQKVTPAAAFSGEDEPTKPGAFKVSSKIIGMMKKEVGYDPQDMMFKRVRNAVAAIPRQELSKAWGIKNDPHVNKTQDFIAGKPRPAFNKWLANVQRVDTKFGKYVREVPENASLLYLLFMIRVSGEDMARIIFKRYFETESGHPGEAKAKARAEDVDDLFESAVGSRHLSMTSDERKLYLKERIEGRVSVRVNNVGYGDFRAGSGPAPGEYGIYVSGNAYDIKDELKKLGLKWDGRAKHWYIRHIRDDFRTHKGNVPEAKIKAALPKVKDLVKRHNDSVLSRNRQTLAQVGYPAQKAPSDKDTKAIVKKVESGLRRGARIDRYGIDMRMMWRGSGTINDADIVFKGNTYPIKDMLKKVGFRFGNGEWSMPYLEYQTIQSRFETNLAKALKAKFGDKPAPREPHADPEAASARIKRQKSTAWKASRRGTMESLQSFLDDRRGINESSGSASAYAELDEEKKLSKVKKKVAPHMWVISKDSSGGYLVTIGDPRKTGSKVVLGRSDKDEIKRWVKYEMPRKVSNNYVIDATGMKLVPDVYTQWFVDNIAEEIELEEGKFTVKGGDKREEIELAEASVGKVSPRKVASVIVKSLGKIGPKPKSVKVLGADAIPSPKGWDWGVVIEVEVITAKGEKVDAKFVIRVSDDSAQGTVSLPRSWGGQIASKSVTNGVNALIKMLTNSTVTHLSNVAKTENLEEFGATLQIEARANGAAVKRAMVKAFVAFFSDHPKKSILKANFVKEIGFRKGTYTNPPYYAVDVWLHDKDRTKKLSSQIADAAKRAGAFVAVVDHGDRIMVIANLEQSSLTADLSEAALDPDVEAEVIARMVKEIRAELVALDRMEKMDQESMKKMKKTLSRSEYAKMQRLAKDGQDAARETRRSLKSRLKLLTSADLSEAIKITQKPGEDYWYVKSGTKVIGVVSGSEGGTFDADTDPDGKGRFKKGFKSKEDASAWIAKNSGVSTEEELVSVTSIGESKKKKDYAKIVARMVKETEAELVAIDRLDAMDRKFMAKAKKTMSADKYAKIEKASREGNKSSDAARKSLEDRLKELKAMMALESHTDRRFDDYERLSLSEKKWIQQAIKKPGRVHRYLGVPEGEDIPAKKIEAAIEKLKSKEDKSKEDTGTLRALILAKRLQKGSKSFESFQFDRVGMLVESSIRDRVKLGDLVAGLGPRSDGLGEAKGLSKMDVKKLLKKHGIKGELSGVGTQWEVEVPNDRELKKLEKAFGKRSGIGGYRTGYGGWVLRPGYSRSPSPAMIDQLGSGAYESGSADLNKIIIDSSRQHPSDRRVPSDNQLMESIMNTRHLAKTVQERDLGEAQRFVIGQGGLEKPGGGKVSILPNREYWLGASSSPTHIIVTKVSDDRISYRSYPFEKESVIERWIAADLIEKGSKKHLSMYGRRMDAADKKSLEDLLRGGKGKPVKYQDLQSVYVLVTKGKGHEGQDLWRDAERYGNVGGMQGPSGEDNGADYRYEISTERRSVEAIKKDKKFTVLKVSKSRAG